jgi:uncharacterized C2H2 Zn-finger protein
MKRKTNFKQMFLVDDTLYNKISNVTPQLPSTMIVGKLPTHLPITNNSNIIKEVLGYATPTQGKIMKSSAMMTEDIPPTHPKIMKSSGMMTEDVPPTTIEVPSQQLQINALQEQLHNSQLQVRTLEASLHTPQLVDHTTQFHALPDYTPPLKNHIIQNVNHVPRNIIRAPRMSDRAPRMNDRAPRMEDRTPRMEDRTPRMEDRTPRMEDRTPRIEDRTSRIEDRTVQLQYRVPRMENQALQMQFPNMTQNIPLQHQINAQQLAIPQASGPLTSYSYPMDTSPALEQLELMDFNTNKALEYQSSAQPMELSETSLPPPVTIATRALAPPDDDECEDCADDSTVTKYVKYNEPGIVALPSAQGLPNNVLFTCTLCNTNFKTQKALQRHMKNQHDAFDQKEKGAKRKRVVPNTNSVDTNTMKKSKTDKNLQNKAVVSYTKYL